MNRREFVKLMAVAVTVPSLISIGKEQTFPCKWKYKGHDIIITQFGGERAFCKQAYVCIDNKHGAVLFDRDDSMEKIERVTKEWIDHLIKRDRRVA